MNKLISNTLKRLVFEKIDKNHYFQILNKNKSEYLIHNYDCLKVLNQANTNCCVPYSIAYIINYLIYAKYELIYDHNNHIIKLKKHNKLLDVSTDVLTDATSDKYNKQIVSEYSIYYYSRMIDKIKDKNIDSGTQIPYAIIALNTDLITSIKDCPDKKEYLINPPPSECMKFDFNLAYGENYFSVRHDLSTIKYYLYLDLPIIFGLNVGPDFLNQTGNKVLNYPTNINNLIGGHAMVIVGFIDKYMAFIVRNSYGEKFSNNGYLLISYKYILSPLAYDLFVIRDLI